MMEKRIVISDNDEKKLKGLLRSAERRGTEERWAAGKEV